MSSSRLGRGLQKLRGSKSDLPLLNDSPKAAKSMHGVPKRFVSSPTIAAVQRNLMHRSRTAAVLLALFFGTLLVTFHSSVPNILHMELDHGMSAVPVAGVPVADSRGYESSHPASYGTDADAVIHMDPDKKREKIAHAAAFILSKFQNMKEKDRQNILKPITRRADLPVAVVDDRSSDECAAAAGTPKVALLFLTRGGITHEDLWSLWFESAADMLPAEAVRMCENGADSALIDGSQTQSIRSACVDALSRRTTAEPGGSSAFAGSGSTNSSSTKGGNTDIPLFESVYQDVISMQHLFNVYVHVPPSVDDSSVPPVWRRRIVSNRVEPEWGTHTLVEATRHLIWESFKDPANQRFVLLSESDVPLYDPLTFYRQVMAEEKSRVDAWLHEKVDFYRWNLDMVNFSPEGNIPKLMWRKSSQWFMLQRKHAEIFLDDVALFRNMEQNCRTGINPKTSRPRTCYSDEHYLPVLLAMKGRRQETVHSMSGICATDWSLGGPHPRSYEPQDVDAVLFSQQLRANENCAFVDHHKAQEEAKKTFVQLSKVFSNAARQSTSSIVNGLEAVIEDSEICYALQEAEAVRQRYPMMKDTCSMTARKFTEETIVSLLKIFANSCDTAADAPSSGTVESSRYPLGLLSDDVCRRAKEMVLPRAEQQLAFPQELISG